MSYFFSLSYIPVSICTLYSRVYYFDLEQRYLCVDCIYVL